MSEDSHEFPKKRIGAGVLIVDEKDRVLLVEPTYKDTWEVPGGMVELGESPRAAVRRECREELGFDVGIGRLLAIDWVTEGRTPGDGIMFMYATDQIDTSRISLPPEELRSWEWCNRETVLTRVKLFQARRIFAALTSLRENSFHELENGEHYAL
ncbi:MAG: NUDIX hydrolase [Actinomycetota bacterium]